MLDSFLICMLWHGFFDNSAQLLVDKVGAGGNCSVTYKNNCFLATESGDDWKLKSDPR